MTQEQFIEAMREHIKWLKKKGGKKADFTGESLCDINFLLIDLQDDDPHPIPRNLFKGVSFVKANLSGADMTACNFYNANFSGANLTGIKANCCNFDNVDMSGANLHAANLAGAKLAYANLCDSNLTYANLSFSDLRFARLSGITGDHLNLTGALLDETRFLYSKLKGADFTAAHMDGELDEGLPSKGPKFDGADLTEAKFIRTELHDASFNCANLTRTVFFRANFCASTGTTKDGKQVMPGTTTFKEAEVDNTILNFSNVGPHFDFTGVDLSECQMNNALRKILEESSKESDTSSTNSMSSF